MCGELTCGGGAITDGGGGGCGCVIADVTTVVGVVDANVMAQVVL